MKKFIAVLLAALMTVSLAACSADNAMTEEETNTTENVSEEETTEETGTTEIQEETDADTSEEEGQDAEADATGSTVLVAYFSATGTTEGVATELADILGADLYEIVPEEPYTDADLNYNDDSSRSTIEMDDPDVRPAISGSVENMDQYETVFVGYPIWWGDAPRIMSTFMESYDFAGKTIVPFCTSGGSGIGSSASNLEALTEGATWLSGTRLNSGASREDITEWVNGLGLEITAE